MPVKYDPNVGCLGTALKLRSTAVPTVLARYEFWLLFNMHLAVGFAYRWGYLGDSDNTPSLLDWNEMKVISGITTFFAVFYTNHCYNRYLDFYAATRLMLGHLLDYCFELRLYLNADCKQHERLATRQIVASFLLFFYELDDVTTDMEWDELVQQGLVRSQEQAFLQQFENSQHSLIMLQWSAEAARDGCTQSKAAANVLKGLMSRLSKCRDLQQEVIDMINLPMPYQHFHLMKSMMLVNLLFWAWGMALTQSIFAPVVYWFALLIFMGLMELAAQLADPFGDDEVDFPLTEWLDDFVENTVVLMEFRSPKAHIKKALDCEQALQLKPPGLRFLLREHEDKANRVVPCDDDQGDSDSFDSSEHGKSEEVLKPLMSA